MRKPKAKTRKTIQREAQSEKIRKVKPRASEFYGTRASGLIYMQLPPEKQRKKGGELLEEIPNENFQRGLKITNLRQRNPEQDNRQKSHTQVNLLKTRVKR